MFSQRLLIDTAVFALLSAMTGLAWAQVDLQAAEQYFEEAQALCERDGGHIWGISLCGPMIFADASTHTLAGSIPVPGGPWPAALGYAGTALDWGGQRWAVYPWNLVHEADVETRGRTMLHELFHRIQPDLDLMTPGGSNEHLDSLEGRFFLAAGMAGAGSGHREYRVRATDSHRGRTGVPSGTTIRVSR